MRVEDGHIVSKAGLAEKVEKTIKPIIMSREYANSEQAQNSFYGKETAAELREEALSNRRLQLAKNYARGLDLTLLEPQKNSKLNQLLALSNNNPNHLSRQYKTIDHIAKDAII